MDARLLPILPCLLGKMWLTKSRTHGVSWIGRGSSAISRDELNFVYTFSVRTFFKLCQYSKGVEYLAELRVYFLDKRRCGLWPSLIYPNITCCLGDIHLCGIWCVPRVDDIQIPCCLCSDLRALRCLDQHWCFNAEQQTLCTSIISILHIPIRVLRYVMQPLCSSGISSISNSFLLHLHMTLEGALMPWCLGASYEAQQSRQSSRQALTGFSISCHLLFWFCVLSPSPGRSSTRYIHTPAAYPILFRISSVPYTTFIVGFPHF